MKATVNVNTPEPEGRRPESLIRTLPPYPLPPMSLHRSEAPWLEGSYENRCLFCAHLFVGHKRDFACKACRGTFSVATAPCHGSRHIGEAICVPRSPAPHEAYI